MIIIWITIWNGFLDYSRPPESVCDDRAFDVTEVWQDMHFYHFSKCG